jgi:outer membrane protein assembly factor BamB
MRAAVIAMTQYLLFVGAPAVLGQENWPEFRGPTGEGQSESSRLPLHWGPDQNVLWKVALPGSGWSSPIVLQGVIYLTAALFDGSGNLGSLRMLAYDLASGGLIWNQEVFAVPSRQSKHAKNSHASPTPIAEGSRVYAHFGPMGTAALDLSGNIVWRQTNLVYSPVHGNGGSPVIVGKMLIFSCDGESDPFIVALDKHTGEIAWRVKRSTPAKKKFSFSTPLLIHVNGHEQLITPGSGVVNALDPATGDDIWHVLYGEGYSVVPRPVFGHGMVYLGSGFERPEVYAIRVDGHGDVTHSKVAWTSARGAPNTPSMLLAGDELYFVSDGGVASCVDARTGQVHWNERLGGDFSASPIHAGNRIYFTNERGRTFVVKASKRFEKLAENDLGERTLASLAVSGPSILIRTEEHLFRLQEAVE